MQNYYDQFILLISNFSLVSSILYMWVQNEQYFPLTNRSENLTHIIGQHVSILANIPFLINFL